jgi:DNA-binding NtrC family response regulator
MNRWQKVLVIDADRNAQTMLRGVLSRYLELASAHDPAEALQELSQQSFDAIIASDMPGLVGIELLREAKRKHPQMRALLLLDHHNLGAIGQAADDPCVDGLLVRPISLTDVLLSLRAPSRQRSMNTRRMSSLTR